MDSVNSADGTPIAFELSGAGKPVILIGGAFNDRSTVAGLAAVLAPHLSAASYDRRGRGGSGPAAPGGYRDAVARETEDLAAVIKAVGGAADVFGHSSGAALALEAAAQGLPIGKLAVYEPSYVTDHSRPRPSAGLADQIAALTGSGRRDEAAELFLTQAAAVPPGMVAGMRTSEMWGWFTALAHTLPYDMAICGPGMVLPAGRFARIGVPVLAIGGGNSPQWAPAAASAVADVVPGGRYVTLGGQDHGVLNQPEALLPLLRGFFDGQE